MFRKMLAVTVAAAALLLGAFSAQADAQHCTYYNVVVAKTVKCADPVDDPGDFSGVLNADGTLKGAKVPAGPYGWHLPSIDPYSGAEAAADSALLATGAGGGDATAPLVHTGGNAAVLGYVGTGLVAFGAVAMGTRRKFFQGALD